MGESFYRVGPSFLSARFLPSVCLFNLSRALSRLSHRMFYLIKASWDALW